MRVRDARGCLYFDIDALTASLQARYALPCSSKPGRMSKRAWKKVLRLQVRRVGRQRLISPLVSPAPHSGVPAVWYSTACRVQHAVADSKKTQAQLVGRQSSSAAAPELSTQEPCTPEASSCVELAVQGCGGGPGPPQGALWQPAGSCGERSLQSSPAACPALQRLAGGECCPGGPGCCLAGCCGGHHCAAVSGAVRLGEGGHEHR